MEVAHTVIITTVTCPGAAGAAKMCQHLIGIMDGTKAAPISSICAWERRKANFLTPRPMKVAIVGPREAFNDSEVARGGSSLACTSRVELAPLTCLNLLAKLPTSIADNLC